MTATPAAILTSTQRHVVLVSCFGTFLEWYDFLTFASLASTLGTVFFPGHDNTTALLYTLATFAVGMIVRPLGAALFGSLADRHGRRPIFLATITLMGLSTCAVGLLPGYQMIGFWAPLLLLGLRVLQGLAMGGEVGGVAVYLSEHAPAARRGLYTSVLQLMGPCGILASRALILLLQWQLSAQQFQAWGWRVPFLLSLLLLLFSLKTRLNMHESPVFQALQRRKNTARAPLLACFQDRRTLGHMALLFFCVSSSGAILFFISQVYSAVFLEHVVGLSPLLINGLSLAAMLALFPLTLGFGALSDRIGRRPVVLAGAVVGCALLLPVFHGLSHFGNPQREQFQAQVLVAGPQCHYLPGFKPANACESNQEWLTQLGVSYVLTPAAQTSVQIAGQTTIAGFAPQALREQLRAARWPEHAQPTAMASGMLLLLLLALTIPLAAVTGPQTALLAELFPARTRYSAVALPHNLSAGWIGGLLSFNVTLISAWTGEANAGLWYPLALLLLAAVVGLLFLPETRNVALES